MLPLRVQGNDKIFERVKIADRYLGSLHPVLNLVHQRGMVTTNLESLRSAIDMKRKNLESIIMVMRRKIGEIENKRAEFKSGDEGGAVATA